VLSGRDAAAGCVLGGLLHVQATRDSRQGARRLVHLVGRSWGSNTRRHLEVLRQDPETDYIAETLLTLHQEEARLERAQQLRKRSIAVHDKAHGSAVDRERQRLLATGLYGCGARR
jgi:hypothetical protein